MRRLSILGLAAGLAACAPVSDRVILLPTPEGRPSGALLVQGAKGQVQLDAPYAQAEVAGGAVKAGAAQPEEVRQRYGAVLAMQPARARVFVVRFESNSDQLTVESLPTLSELKAALAQMPAAEVVVIGHTDRVGSVEANDRLSLQRAQAVRELLVAAGVARELISVAGRGERETLVDTADEVAEPRNRRVEIKLR